MKKIFAVLSFTILGTTAAFAADGTSTATATVITPIAIAKTANLAFGQFAAGSGGTVVMSNAGARSASGGVVLSSENKGAQGTFDVSGDANATYAITLPSAAISIFLAGDTLSTTKMSVDTFNSNPATTGTLDGTGKQVLAVGATLHVASAQTVGSYSGDFVVKVEYN